MRPTFFPDDWIKPREFHCCSCGNYLTLRNAKDNQDVKICDVCSIPRGGVFTIVENSWLEAFRWWWWNKFWKYPRLNRLFPPRKDPGIVKATKLHKQLSDERIKLATERRSQGIPPLFWVEVK
jgi:hypothetical protein